MPAPARVVIDTNTFVSAILRTGSIPANAVDKAFDTGQVLQSVDTWLELEDVLQREKFERYKALALRRTFLDFLQEALEPVSILTKLSVCRHPKDDKFLELAVDGRAAVIVTGDDDLLVLKSFSRDSDSYAKGLYGVVMCPSNIRRLGWHS